MPTRAEWRTRVDAFAAGGDGVECVGWVTAQNGIGLWSEDRAGTTAARCILSLLPLELLLLHTTSFVLIPDIDGLDVAGARVGQSGE